MEKTAKGGIKNFEKNLSQVPLFAVPTLLILIAFIFREVKLKEIPQIINPFGFLYILLVLILVWVFNALKMKLVVQIMGEDISFKTSFQIVLAAVFGANITPFFTGGALSQVYFLSKECKSIGKSSAVTFVYVILSAIISIIFCIIFLLIPHHFLTGLRGGFFIGLIALVLFLSSIAIILIRIPNKTGNFIERVYLSITKKEINKEKLWKIIKEFDEGFNLLIKGGAKRIILLLIVSFVSQLFYILLAPLSFYALNIPFSFPKILLTQIALLYAASLGFSPGGIGVIEGTFAGFFFPYAMGKIALLTFVYRIFSFYIPTIVGTIFFYKLLKKD